MDEFITRLVFVLDSDRKKSGDDSPLDSHLDALNRMMKGWSRRKKR